MQIFFFGEKKNKSENSVVQPNEERGKTGDADREMLR
jgi:hypothetical protein